MVRLTPDDIEFLTDLSNTICNANYIVETIDFDPNKGELFIKFCREED